MFTLNDINTKSIFVVNCLEGKTLRVEAGILLLEDTVSGTKLTKLPFQKILALMIIGHIKITSPLIEKCTQFGIPVVVTKTNFRPVFFYSVTAEANFLLRKKQYTYFDNELVIARNLVDNKIQNQIKLLKNTRLKKIQIVNAKKQLSIILDKVDIADDYDFLMGLEGSAAKIFFQAYFDDLNWKSRKPRTKIDPINATLDIGYTILFNYIECFVRMFGFDPYIGVYHKLWFKRKSLICDLMEPFRCIIDNQVRKAFNLKQCTNDDFKYLKNEYLLKYDKNSQYSKMFYETLVEYKQDIFIYVRDYYRCFMQKKSVPNYPKFHI